VSEIRLMLSRWVDYLLTFSYAKLKKYS